MYAIDDLGDAIDATRNLLTPVTAGMWLRLAIVTFFVGGVGANFPSSGDTGGIPTDETIDLTQLVPPAEELVVVGLIAAIVLAISLAVALIAAIMEFVLLETLRSDEIGILDYAGRHFDPALRLFGFRLALGVIGLAIGAGAFFLVIDDPSAVTFEQLIPLFPIAIVLAIVFGIVDSFTTNFVAPIMLVESCGVLEAWRRFWPALVGNWTEFLLYVVLVALLSIVVAIAVLVLFIPLALIALVLTLVTLGLALIVLIPAFILFALLVNVPIVVYFRYYAVLLLGDVDEELDLIPEQRAAVRGGDVTDEAY